MSPLWQRIEKSVFAIVAVLIVTGCMMVLYAAQNALFGQSTAERKGANATGELTIRFADGLRERAKRTGTPHHLEMGWCLYGTFYDNTYFIRKLIIPREIERSRTTARFGCQRTGDYLGSMHSHPSGSAYPSEGDLERLSQDHIVIIGIYTTEPIPHINLFHTRDRQCFVTVPIDPSESIETCGGN